MENQKIWYAVCVNSEDTDWGYGSFNKETAKGMLQRAKQDDETAYIAVIEEGDDPICIDEIYNVDEM